MQCANFKHTAKRFSYTHTHMYVYGSFSLYAITGIEYSPLYFYSIPRWPSGKEYIAKQEPQEMWVRPLSQKDPLEEGMAAHSSLLAWRIPWTEEPDGLQSMGLQRVGHDLVTELLFILYTVVYMLIPTS